jgi:hypothetical protein
MKTIRGVIMENYLDRQYISPNDREIIGTNDSKSIQNAVDTAKETGVNQVIIPHINARTKQSVWIIDETVLLPDDITVILDNCTLKMADGVMCNLFRNSNFYGENANLLSGEQKNIFIHGIGNAVLDGGTYNGLSERNSLKNGLPHISNNTMLFFHNIRNFEVTGLRIKNHRWWAMTYLFARDGKISDIDFRADLTAKDDNGSRLEGKVAKGYEELLIKNTDGIDLRVGCNNITIENITGITGDDTIALTALIGKHFEKNMLVSKRDTDIHSVIIRNVKSNPHGCANVRLLNHDGNKLYNIIIETIIDTSDETSGYQPGATIRIGEKHYISERPVCHGETYGITVRNVLSRARTAVCMSATCMNSYFNNIQMFGDGETAIGTLNGGEFENLLFDGISFSPNRTCSEPFGYVCDLLNSTGKNVVFQNIFAEKIKSPARVSGGICVEFASLRTGESKTEKAECDALSKVSIVSK